MIKPISVIVAATGLAVAAIGGVALGQYTVSGLDPTKATAYAASAEAYRVASDDSGQPGIGAAATVPVGYAPGSEPPTLAAPTLSY